MEKLELARLVARCRRVQKEFLRTRSTTKLEESRRLERLVDSEVEEILRQPTLFDGVAD